MKYIWIFLLTALGLVTPTPTPAPVTQNADPFTYSLIKPAGSVRLIPNFTQKRDSGSLIDANGCRAAINGGFYDTDAKPLGFFYTDGTIIGKQIRSALVNGFFAADEQEIPFISAVLPDITYGFALQTGPLLFMNGEKLPLVIQNDEPVRRMVAAKTTDNRIIFITVYNGNSVYEGPRLADLPEIISGINAKENLEISDAVNLDGGSASAFYNGDTRLSELTPVGSLFCIK